MSWQNYVKWKTRTPLTLEEVDGPGAVYAQEEKVSDRDTMEKEQKIMMTDDGAFHFASI